VNKLATIAIIILLACGGALWFLANGSLNEYIKQQIELVGGNLTEQVVLVKAVDIKPSQGMGAILGLSVGNVKGYSQPNIFSLDNIKLDINIESLMDEPIVIDEVLIDKPQFFIEVNKNGQANVKDLLDIIQSHIPASNESKQTENTTNNTADEPKIRLDKFTLSGSKLTLDLTQLGNKVHQLTLEDINIASIGGESGLPASQLGAELAKQMLKAVWAKAKSEQKSILKKKVTDKIKDKLKGLVSDNTKKKLSGFLDNLKQN
jgi:hypothetical protein